LCLLAFEAVGVPSLFVWSAKFLPFGSLVNSMGLIECWAMFMEYVVGILVVGDSS